MKPNYLVLFTLAATLLVQACVTSTVSTADEQELTTVLPFSEMPKEEIFDRAIEYIARNYNSADSVIQLSDEDRGQIVARGISYSAGDSFDFNIKRPFRYTLLIDVKEEKMRIRYENIESVNINGVAGPNMQYQWGSVEESIQLEMASIQQFVSSQKSSDW